MLFYNLPFEIWGLRVADMLIMTATVLSIVSGIEYYVNNKQYLMSNYVSLNKEKLNAFDQVITTADLLDGKYLLVQRGKKNYYLVIAK